MKQYRHKKKMNMATKLAIIAVTLVLCGTFIYKNATLKAEKREYAVQLQELQKQQKKVKQETKDLEKYKDYVKSDDYVEKVARDKFGLVNKGEIIFEPENKE